MEAKLLFFVQKFLTTSLLWGEAQSCKSRCLLNQSLVSGFSKLFFYNVPVTSHRLNSDIKTT